MLQELVVIPCAIAYALWPSAYHAFMEYAAEDNIDALTTALDDVLVGHVKFLQHMPAPAAAKQHWCLPVRCRSQGQVSHFSFPKTSGLTVLHSH